MPQPENDALLLALNVVINAGYTVVGNARSLWKNQNQYLCTTVNGNTVYPTATEAAQQFLTFGKPIPIQKEEIISDGPVS